MKLFGILLHGRFVSFPHLFIHSVTYIRLDSWTFILHFGLYSSITILLLKIFQLLPLVPLSVVSSASLTFPHWVFFEHLFTFGPAKCAELILYISCPSPRISNFSEKPCMYNILCHGRLHSGHTCGS